MSVWSEGYITSLPLINHTIQTPTILFRLFSSKLFTFVVGEKEARITAHANAIANQSVTLDALINGSMNEAQTGVAVLKDVQEDTFVRFCQYAYIGNYKAPDHDNVPGLKPAVLNQSEPTPEITNRPIAKPTSKKNEAPASSPGSKATRFDETSQDAENLHLIPFSRK
ncbi:hypothetical protein B7463_g4426, partial [Scytalidium lignicola]